MVVPPEFLYKSDYMRVRAELSEHFDEFIGICKNSKDFEELGHVWRQYQGVSRDFGVGLLILMAHFLVFAAFSVLFAQPELMDKELTVFLLAIWTFFSLVVFPLLTEEVFPFIRLGKSRFPGLPDMSAAVSIYFSLIYLFAFGFIFVVHQAGSEYQVFSKPLDTSDMLYFSAVTITTLGYGDIYPVSTASRILANLESITGVLFITYSIVILTTVVSAQSARRERIRETTNQFVASTIDTIIDKYETVTGAPLKDPENFARTVLFKRLWDYFEKKEYRKQNQS